MAYRLALDVGTASCGLVAWSLDETGSPRTLDFYSLDIWQEPLLPAKSGGVGEPKKAARRAARMMRRLISRRARRLRRVALAAGKLGLDPKAIPSDTGQSIHRLRAHAAEARVELAQLIPILLHLAKNRGPSGDWVYTEPKVERKGHSRKAGATSETAVASEPATETPAGKAAAEKKGIADRVRELEREIVSTAASLGKDSITLGQYLHWRHEHGQSTTLGRADIGLYPSRRMVEHEFRQIWNTQAAFHPELRDEAIEEEFFNAIFHQRPLKSPAPMVGRCPLEPTLPRAPAAQMAAQAFRIEKQIADLRWGIGRRAEPLSPDQKSVVRTLLDSQAEVKFTSILKALDEAGVPGPGARGLNMDRSSRESLKGNSTLAVFRRLGLEGDWRALDERIQIQVINFLADLGSPDALDSDDWHSNFQKIAREEGGRKYKKPLRVHRNQIKVEPRRFEPDFIRFIDQLRRHEDFGRLSAMKFDGGRMGYSVKALRQLTALMRDGLDEHAAISKAYPDHNKPKALSTDLQLPPETGNTVVDVAMRQVYRAVKRTMDSLKGTPSEVIVELSRDLALGVGKRNEIETRTKLNEKARCDAAKALESHHQASTERNIQRYLLWESQGHYCPYCEQGRITLGEALGGETEREHILPRSLTRVGGKRSQLVLAHRLCNRQKGNRTPWQAFGGDEARWRVIEERAALLKSKKQFGKARLLLLKDWEDEVLDDEAIKGFSDRQFHESSWIAKLTAQWLRSVCANVAVSRGELTAHLRRIWKLNTVIPEVRFDTGLPVLDKDGKPISREEFDRHQSWWEGHGRNAGAIETEREPDKRIDHRHHLVDALVISLTSRSLFSRMAQNYKEAREKERRGERGRLTLHEEPPVPALRDLAVEIVRNVAGEIRHKPDRFPDGPLFEQTAYGRSRKPDSRSGEYRLAVSKALKVLIDPASAAKTRSRLESIEGEQTREAVLSAFDSRLAAGHSLKRVFDEPVNHPQFRTPIRRVRVLDNAEQTAAVVKHSNRLGDVLDKRYVHGGNAYLEIKIENGKIVEAPRLVNVQQAMREKGSRPPSGVRRFWKGDTVRLKDGSLHIVGIIAAQGGGQLRLVPVTETCTFGELKKRGLTMRSVSGDALCAVQVIDV